MPATNMQMDIGLVLLTAVEADVDGSGCGDLQPDPEATYQGSLKVVLRRVLRGAVAVDACCLLSKHD
jgi:hypothetical protein